MSFLIEKRFSPAVQFPEEPAAGAADSELNIAVIFTAVEPTLSALRRAAVLANRLSARITLLAPQVVPYPLPLADPPVALGSTERRFRVIADQSPVETSVRIYLCRNRSETLAAVLKPHSLVVIGNRGGWWLSEEKRLGRRLRRAGH